MFSRVTFALLLLLVAGVLGAPAGAQSADDEKCLGCHAEEGLAKTFAQGEKRSLRVKGEDVAKSVHGPLGCSGCHADVDLAKHPGDAAAFGSEREFAIAKAAACVQCHDESASQYQGSVHAARVKAGNPLAPVCTGCHGAHDVTPRTAYQTCVGCHAAALDAHRSWLPNSAQHHETVSCAACHAPAAPRMVDLRFYDRAAQAWVSEQAGKPWFEKLAKAVDAGNDGLDAAELRELLKRINQEAVAAPATLRGRIELRSNAEAHRLSDKSQAIRACDGCHRAGAEPFQKVAVSVNGADGRALRHAAQRQVLDSPQAMATLPEFYAIGGTRSPLLDALFLLALAGGIGVPAVHMSVRWVVRKFFSKER